MGNFVDGAACQICIFEISVWLQDKEWNEGSAAGSMGKFLNISEPQFLHL